MTIYLPAIEFIVILTTEIHLTNRLEVLDSHILQFLRQMEYSLMILKMPYCLHLELQEMVLEIIDPLLHIIELTFQEKASLGNMHL
jgi:hypothetical protein